MKYEERKYRKGIYYAGSWLTYSGMTMIDGDDD